ncbi:MAG TPA: bifunctional protein-serine/threonine kinase/phosphatase [Ramlibacter sp.]|nr:bifunctional protein-serine/threonine kinase/phosphatase [Ramlibacter sp.]
MLSVRIGQHSDKGRREIQQDFHGATLPREPQLSAKGVAIALADGIGSSPVSGAASEFAVMGLLEDYYCTSDAWSVRKSVDRVLAATNSWLHSRTQAGPDRNDMERGYVCTLSALVIKSTTAHLFHVGDSRVWRMHGRTLEPLTQEHRVWVSGGQSYLARAMGFNAQVDIDYRQLPVEVGDTFVLTTDGVHEHVTPREMAAIIAAHPDDLDAASVEIVAAALRNGSSDNLTVQVVRVDSLPQRQATELHHRLAGLPPPAILSPREEIDGYRVMREVHGSPRSHIYLAVDTRTNQPVILKAPSVDRQDDPAYIERFLMEEWVARRVNSAHLLKPVDLAHERTAIYLAMEYVEGQTLAQWIIDHPRPDLESVRAIIEQVAKGLQALHRMEMLHQDLRPENIMIDASGTVKIIDFGAVSVAGLQEMHARDAAILGTEQYTAPEYFVGDVPDERSDLYSLGAIAYQMLCGRLPYGAEVSRARTKAAQSRLRYRSVLSDEREIPAWIDEVLAKALQPNPAKRYESLSGFVFDLRHPNPQFTHRGPVPLVERNPVAFWKAVSAALGIALLLVLFIRLGR